MHSKRWHKGYAMPPSTTQARRDEPLYFYGDSRHPHYEFSNFSPHDVEYHGQIYPTAAHLFQVMKFITVAPDIAEKIKHQRDPLEATRKAKEYERHQRPDWSMVMVDVMYDVLKRKFYRHPLLQQALVETGTRPLIEDSKTDGFWGIGADGNGENWMGRSLMRLREKIRQPIKFHGRQDPYFEFSNFSPHGVVYKGSRYPSAQHLFEAYKFFTTAPEISERIRQLPKPRDALAEALKSELKDLVRADWHDVRVRVMERVLEMKFTQHQELRQILLSTGGRELVNDSTDDVFWGAGQDGKGHNELGKVLMRLRAKLQYGD